MTGPGAWHQIYTSVPPDGAQQTPTQGHVEDMGTPQNTAAIYVRRSAVDSENTEADAFSRSLAAFLPLSGEQVATILGVVAVLTGERVVRKVRA